MFNYLRRIDPTNLFLLQAAIALFNIGFVVVSHFFPAVCS